MGVSCAAYGCTERHNKNNGISFHRFPRDENLKKKWIIAIKRNNFNPSDCARLCSKHFKPEDFKRQFGQLSLVKTAVPSIFNSPEHSIKKKICRRKPFRSSRILQKPTVNIVKEEVDPPIWTPRISDPFCSVKHEQFNGTGDMIPEEEIKMEIEEHLLSEDMADPLEIKPEPYRNLPSTSQEHIKYCLRRDHTYTTTPNRWKQKYENLMQLHTRLKSKFKSSQKRICRLLKKIEKMELSIETSKQSDV